MPGSAILAFSEPDDYEVAMRTDGGFDLLVTGRGEFRAELTRITLPHVSLTAGDENLSRIAFLSLPDKVIRVALPSRGGGSPCLAGVPSQAGEIVAHCGGHRLFERTDGSSRWRTIWFSAHELMVHGRVLIGATFQMPIRTGRWRPAPDALKSLADLHDSAIRTNRAQPRITAGSEAARGLEQQLFHAFIDCLADLNPDGQTVAAPGCADVMERFQGLIGAGPGKFLSSPGICAALGIPAKTLRACCEEHLGIGPLRYLYLQRLQLVRRALRSAESDPMTASDIAHRYGFQHFGRFAKAYRRQFGEAPAVLSAAPTPDPARQSN